MLFLGGSRVTDGGMVSVSKLTRPTVSWSGRHHSYRHGDSYARSPEATQKIRAQRRRRSPTPPSERLCPIARSSVVVQQHRGFDIVFDSHRKWLGITADVQPSNGYRLLCRNRNLKNAKPSLGVVNHERPAVGIDLGTTFSVIAHLDSAGRPWTIPNAEGDLITPSVVFFDGTSAVVGKEAQKAAVAAPEEVAEFVKRDMGCQVYQKAIHGEHLPPEVIQSYILDKLRRDATLKLGEFRKVVITVPAFFNEPRRKATQDAGALAGLEVIDIINEPTAAAIAYGIQQGFLTRQRGIKTEGTASRLRSRRWNVRCHAHGN